MSRKVELRNRRKNRIRAFISGVSSRPRVSVFRSLRGFSAQVIDDEKGVTIASASVKESGVSGALKVAELLSGKYSGPCVFDRNGYSYHGRVKAFADSLREKGFDF